METIQCTYSVICKWNYLFYYYREWNYFIYYENNDKSVMALPHKVLHMMSRLMISSSSRLQHSGMKAPCRRGRITQVLLLPIVTIVHPYSTYYMPVVVAKALHTFKPHQPFKVDDIIPSSML